MTPDAAALALRNLLALIDEGLLVRNTTNDAHFPSYLKESARIVKVIAEAQHVVALADAKEDLRRA